MTLNNLCNQFQYREEEYQIQSNCVFYERDQNRYNILCMNVCPKNELNVIG